MLPVEQTHPFKPTPAGRATAVVPVLVPLRTVCDVRKCKGPKTGPACPRQLSITVDTIVPHSGASLIRSSLDSSITAWRNTESSQASTVESTRNAEPSNLIW